MKTRLTFLLAACLVSASPIAMAADASPQEAARLETLFKSFMGDGAEALSVKANGEFYEVTIDIEGQIKKDAKPGVVAKMTPLVIKLQDQGNGKWTAAQGAPFSFESSETKDGKETKIK